tara:strand:+ start:336 stop:653 length:318 start_codon:yes stop_codon:yes gene_type:complete
MTGVLKVIGSNNKHMPLGVQCERAELIANKLIVNYRAVEGRDLGGAYESYSSHSPMHRWEPVLEEKILTLDIKNVNICDQHIHVDAWHVDEESNGGRIEFELFWS